MAVVGISGIKITRGEDAHFGVLMYLASIFPSIILLDAAPAVVRADKTLKYGLLVGILNLLWFNLMLCMSAESNTLYINSYVDVRFVGKISVIQRMVLGPVTIATVLFTKNVVNMFRNPENMVIRSALIKDYTFKDIAEFQAFLKKQHDCIIASGESKLQNRELNTPHFRVLESAFKPIIVDSRQSLAAAIFGPRAGHSLWSFLKAHLYINTYQHFCGRAISLLTLTGHLPKSFALLSLPGGIVGLANFATCNIEKVRVLCKTFVPLYLGSLSFIMCLGIAISFSDIRAISAVGMLSDLLLASFTDAMNSANRRIAGLYIGLIIVNLLSWGSILYFEAAHDLSVYTLHFPGSVISVTSVQAMILSPLLAIIPYLLLFFFHSVYHKERYCSIRAPLKELPFSDLASTNKYFEARRISVISKRHKDVPRKTYVVPLSSLDTKESGEQINK